MIKIGLSVFAIILIGAGCLPKSAPGSMNTTTSVGKKENPQATEQAQNVLEETKDDPLVNKAAGEVMYINTLGKYSIVYNYVYGFGVTDRPRSGPDASPTSREVHLFLAYPDYGPNPPDPEDTSPVTVFKLEKTTVYPENRMGQLKKEYFPGSNKIVTNNITLGGKSGWEMKSENESDKVYRVIYFPLADNELIIIEPHQRKEDYDSIIATLKFIQ